MIWSAVKDNFQGYKIIFIPLISLSKWESWEWELWP